MKPRRILPECSLHKTVLLRQQPLPQYVAVRVCPVCQHVARIKIKLAMRGSYDARINLAGVR